MSFASECDAIGLDYLQIRIKFTDYGLDFPPETIIMCVVVFIMFIPLFNMFALCSAKWRCEKKKSLPRVMVRLAYTRCLACLLPESTASKIGG
jgi:hypothetical protein